MTLDDMVRDAASGLFVPAQARRQVIPYDDLQALNPPLTNPQISADLISTLAVLVAQGANGPRLLSADINGRLQTVAPAAAITKLTDSLIAPAATAHVADSSPFYPGQSVSLVGTVSGEATCTAVLIKSIPDVHTIVFNGICTGFSYQPGDEVVGGGDTRVTSVLVPVDIGGATTVLPPGAPNPGDQNVSLTGNIAGHKRFATDSERSWDWFKFVPQGTGAAITGTQVGFGLGTAIVVGCVIFSCNANAAGVIDHAQLWIDAVTTGTQVFDVSLEPATAGSTQILVLDRLRLRGNNNGNMAITMTSVSANVFHSCMMAGWIEGV